MKNQRLLNSEQKMKNGMKTHGPIPHKNKVSINHRCCKEEHSKNGCSFNLSEYTSYYKWIM